MILYADGVTPGSTLTPENKRKATVWYASFKEFGWKLSFEEMWITIAIARTIASLCNVCMHIHLAVTTARWMLLRAALLASKGGNYRS